MLKDLSASLFVYPTPVRVPTSRIVKHKATRETVSCPSVGGPQIPYFEFPKLVMSPKAVRVFRVPRPESLNF